MGTTTTSNMGLPLPNVSEQAGPTWAENVNQSLTQIDSHNHTSGQGVPVTAGGININGDLTFSSYNVTDIRTTRYTSLGSAASSGVDLGCIYVTSQDLWYNDTTGRQIRLTQQGQINSSSGNIIGLISPATVTYTPGNSTFTFQSSANTAAILDAASYVLRSTTANSNAVTIKASSATGTYSLTMPNALPSSASVLKLNSNGTIVSQGVQTRIRMRHNAFGSGYKFIRTFLNTAGSSAIVEGSDVTYNSNATSGDSFTINTKGLYYLNEIDGSSGHTNCSAGFTLNNTQGVVGIDSVNGAAVLCYQGVNTIATLFQSSIVAYLDVGDVIRVHASGSGSPDATDTGSFSGVSIVKVSP